MADICGEHGTARRRIIWKKKYSGLGLSELRELRQLREENSKLNTVADLRRPALLQEMVKKAVRPRHRRELGRRTQAVFVLSTRWVSGLMMSIERR